MLTHQNHKHIFMSGISFQALPRLGALFDMVARQWWLLAQERINWDRSFDAHISFLMKANTCGFSGLRDFIGTGWYSSEYIVGTKSIGRLELTAGIGFGRLAGRNTFSNPLRVFSSRFINRDKNSHGKGGTLGTINWFQGDAAGFYGLRYKIGDKVTISSEYTSDLMLPEDQYLEIKSPWNLGVAFEINNYLNLSTQYLHGSQLSTANVKFNLGRPPCWEEKNCTSPYAIEGNDALPLKENSENTIKKVLSADNFKIQYLKFEPKTVHIGVNNTNFDQPRKLWSCSKYTRKIHI